MCTYPFGHIDIPPVVINSLNLHTIPIPNFCSRRRPLTLNTIYIEINVSVITLTALPRCVYSFGTRVRILCAYISKSNQLHFRYLS